MSNNPLGPIRHPFFQLKHYWAPRCRTQEGMNSCFQGTVVSLAERYTVSGEILCMTIQFAINNVL